MELHDAARRIFGQYWALILGIVLLGIGVGALMHRGEAPSYTASARLALDTQDPKSQPESAAVADIANAIATSPSQTQAAIAAAHVAGRDPVDVAKNHVKVQALGSSGLVQLSVSDRSPRAAAAIANALANRVIATRMAVTQGQGEQIKASLDRRIAAANQTIARLDAKIDDLTLRSSTAQSPGVANGLRASRDEASRQRDFAAQQRAVLESERVSLLSNGALQPKPSVISAATPPNHADPTGRKTDMALGGLLGLLVALGLAGLLETLRPTLLGADAVASELDVPVLGTLTAKRNAAARRADLADTAARLRLAARAAGLRDVHLVPARPGTDLGSLADELESLLGQPHVQLDKPAVRGPQRILAGAPTGTAAAVAHAEPFAYEGGPEHREVRIEPFQAGDPSLNNGRRVGLILVCPLRLKKAALRDISHLLRINTAPLLGVVTYRS